MAVVDPMKVNGLDLVRAIGELDQATLTRLDKALGVIGKKVQKDARRAIPVLSGAAKGSVVFKVQARKVYVTAGKGVPHYGWLDFGGTTGKGHKNGAYKGSIKRQRRKAGRYVYPALGDAWPFIVDALHKVLADAAKDSGLEARRVQ